MNIEIHKLAPEIAEDYARFFDETPHNDEFKHKCYCVSWCADAAEGERWPDKTAERRTVAVERVKNGHIRGYLACHDNKIVGWCNANTKSNCRNVIKHTACDKNNFIIFCEVTPGNVHDSTVFDTVYDDVVDKFEQVKTVTVDAGYKSPFSYK